MNLILDKLDKKEKIREIKSRIERQKGDIEQLKRYIEHLENNIKNMETRKEKLEISSLPILLFMIDETLPMPDDEKDYIYEYVYYCPDLDDIKYVVKNRKHELLPNAIDLRECFVEFGVPRKIFPGRAIDYEDQIKNAVSVLNKESIDYISNNQDITWQDLGLYLVNNLYNEDVVKVLKPKNK